MLQFWCADGSDSDENKEYLIEVEAMSINIFDISGDEDIARIAFMVIYVKY